MNRLVDDECFSRIELGKGPYKRAGFRAFSEDDDYVHMGANKFEGGDAFEDSEGDISIENEEDLDEVEDYDEEIEVLDEDPGDDDELGE